MKMQVLSTEMIKPSSPTPHHLRKLKLSYIDQLHRTYFIPFIFFYPANESTGLTTSNHSQISHFLKQSLSHTLNTFYPLAGTVDGDGSVADCNDAGVQFVESRVEAPLDIEAVKECNSDELGTFLPFNPNDDKRTTLTAAKVTFFKCGGMCFAFLVSHRISDGETAGAFINAWAATCRGQPNSTQLCFNLAQYFPARASLPNQNRNFMALSDENCVARRFVFDEETVRVLKQEAASTLVPYPSKVEAVSAFIWMHLIASVTKSTNAEGTFPAMQAVSLRGRTKPPLSLKNAFGNCYMLSLGLYHAKSTCAVSDRYRELVSLLRGMVKKIDHDYITKAQHGDHYLDDFPLFSSTQTKEAGAWMEECVFSSWSSFRLYEVDFGWGSPTWVCTTPSVARNAVILMSTKCGKGIDTLITMDKDRLDMLAAKIKIKTDRHVQHESPRMI